MGVKKSVVATSARSSLRRNTAASSRVAASTSTRGSTTLGRWRSTSASSTAPSLQAQPAPCDRAVRRNFGLGAAVSVMLGVAVAWVVIVARKSTPARPGGTPARDGLSPAARRAAP